MQQTCFQWFVLFLRKISKNNQTKKFSKKKKKTDTTLILQMIDMIPKLTLFFYQE